MTSLNEFTKQILNGQARAIAKAITLVESALERDRLQAAKLLQGLPSPAKPCRRLGLSGVPGVGKSSFIENYGLLLLKDPNRRLAVLAVDPSSPVHGGSIMGDKTRMQHLSAHERAFIRPSPSAMTLGGVGPRTREAIVILEAAGFTDIIVETVGVGQSEAEVASMTDIFVYLQMPSTGDEIQGMKKGVLELADIIAVHKDDGEHRGPARLAVQQLKGAFGYQHNCEKIILAASSVRPGGLEELTAVIADFWNDLNQRDSLKVKRSAQAQSWLIGLCKEHLWKKVQESPGWSQELQSATLQISDGFQKMPSEIAEKLITKALKI